MSSLVVHARWTFAGLLISCLVWIAAGANAADAERTVRSTLQVQATTEEAAVQSQDRIDQLADQASSALAEYRAAVQALDRVRIYNNHLDRLVRDQESTKADLTRQLSDASTIEQEIIPLMLRMIDDLDAFIDLDVPFSLDERNNRIDELRHMMDLADVTVSEKFRRIMSAYQIETDFGRDMEAYMDTLDTGAQPRQVDFLRVGRLVLAYQTSDRKETGYWNRATRSWEVLPDEYRASVTEGLRIARKQAAPELLKLPVSGPEAAQ